MSHGYLSSLLKLIGKAIDFGSSIIAWPIAIALHFSFTLGGLVIGIIVGNWVYSKIRFNVINWVVAVIVALFVTAICVRSETLVAAHLFALEKQEAESLDDY